MKKYLLILWIIFFSINLGFKEAEGKKLGLIIAIGNYPSETGWKTISSLNDVGLIQSVLEKQGFDDVAIIRDQEADKKGIVKALETLLIKAGKNDLVFIHFSAHGQQIMDLDGDELDGLDEAIVPYGAPAYYEEGEDFQKHLSDDDLGEIVEKIRTKIGKNGDLLITIDACHSGTATRGDAITRGGVPPLVPKGYESRSTSEKKESFVSNNVASTRGNPAQMSPMVVISGAAPDELNYEYQGVGSLSLAINKAFSRISTNFTYRTLFAQIVKEMSIIAPKQTPVIEGDVDRELFGGKIVNQEFYLTIDQLNKDAAMIPYGALNGIQEGTTVAIFPAGTISTKGQIPMSTGRVIYAEAQVSNIILDKPLDGMAADYWVFVKQRSFGDVRTTVKLNEFQDKNLQKKLKNFLDKSPVALVQAENSTFTIRENGGLATLTFTHSGDVFEANILLDDEFTQLNEILLSYTQGLFLKNLELHNPDYEVALAFIPVKLQGRQVVDTLDIQNFMDEKGVPTFTTQDKVLLKITNHGSFPIYFNIIDIQPDGIINAIAPDPRRNESLSEYKLEPGQSHILRNRYIGFGPPFGLETFKVFASYQPLNLTPIVRSKGQAVTRGNLTNQMEILFSDAFSLSRGASVGDLSNELDAASFSFPFFIKATN